MTIKLIYFCKKCGYETKPQPNIPSAEMGHPCPTAKGRQWRVLEKREIEQ